MSSLFLVACLCLSQSPGATANAPENHAFNDPFDAYPEVRQGLFLHLCDTVHRKKIVSVPGNLLAAEFDLDAMRILSLSDRYKITSLCLQVYDVKFKRKQTEGSTWKWLWSGPGSVISSQDRASVWALSAKDGSRFLLSTANRDAYEIFCIQTYDRQSRIDSIWLLAYEVLQSLEPGLIRDWKNYLAAHESSQNGR